MHYSFQFRMVKGSAPLKPNWNHYKPFLNGLVVWFELGFGMAQAELN